MNDNSNDNNNPELQQLRDFVISAADKEAVLSLSVHGLRSAVTP